VNRYAPVVRKVTIEFDEKIEAEVEKALGTRGLNATVDQSFRTVLALKIRMELVHQLRDMNGLDLDRQDVMRRAWDD
jgi:Arc/MetJ family transcription regulator